MLAFQLIGLSDYFYEGYANFAVVVGNTETGGSLGGFTNARFTEELDKELSKIFLYISQAVLKINHVGLRYEGSHALGAIFRDVFE